MPALLIPPPEIEIEHQFIVFPQYPFSPAIACRQNTFIAADITNIDVSAAPPTLRIHNELLFVSAKHKDELIRFAETNQIPVIKRVDVWDGLLEPFLDTEYSDETHRRIVRWLATYDIAEAQINEIREEVGKQMYNYNFCTMLWEWVHLGAFDVLCAMRATYSKDKFTDFYRRVMDVALLPDK